VIVAALLVPVVGGVASSQVWNAPAADLASSHRGATDDWEPPAQTVVEQHRLVPQMQVVEGQEMRKAPRETHEEADPGGLRDKAEAAVATGPFSFRIGSFNVLGSQHTGPGGSRSKYPAATTRTAGAANLVAKHGVDVLGTQELQADQLRDLQGRTGMAAYPGFAWGEAETDNSVLWDPGVFELVTGSRFTINFMGRPRPQPIVRLRHLATGQELYVVNTHPSAGGGKYAAERANGHHTLVSVVNGLQDEGVPVLVTGDMNDREAFYCRVVPAAGLTASNGGSYAGGCTPPPQPLPVDWVVGSDASWSNYWRDTTPVEQRISDHFFISAMAGIG
jgi:endonuclease/exonuclease/phosphatase family metal-dependent hydrolase